MSRRVEQEPYSIGCLSVIDILVNGTFWPTLPLNKILTRSVFIRSSTIDNQQNFEKKCYRDMRTIDIIRDYFPPY